MNLPIEKMLCLSTGHITVEANDFLHTQTLPSRSSELIVYEYDFGYRIPVICEHLTLDEVPECIIHCMRLAEAADCAWLLLDNACDTVDFLPTYEW